MSKFNLIKQTVKQTLDDFFQVQKELNMEEDEYIGKILIDEEDTDILAQAITESLERLVNKDENID